MSNDTVTLSRAQRLAQFLSPDEDCEPWEPWEVDDPTGTCPPVPTYEGLPRYAVLYRGPRGVDRSFDVCLTWEQALQAAYDSLADGGWAPRCIVDLDTGVARRLGILAFGDDTTWEECF